MRYLVISDLHANWKALEAVLGEARGGYDAVACCGDVVGYGPDPDRAVDWVRENASAVIRGNHDRACCGLDDLEWFNPIAREASLWTMAHTRPDNLAWLRTLPTGPVFLDGFALAHGSPLDEDDYICSLADAAHLFRYLEASVTFFGHTHLQGVFSHAEGKQRRDSAEHQRLDPDGLYLVNPGSVGQPRDGDPRAAYALYDANARELLLRRVPYDHAAVRRKIEACGLPPALGARLASGR